MDLELSAGTGCRRRLFNIPESVKSVRLCVSCCEADCDVSVVAGGGKACWEGRVWDNDAFVPNREHKGAAMSWEEAAFAVVVLLLFSFVASACVFSNLFWRSI